jgi:polyferredoxin
MIATPQTVNSASPAQISPCGSTVRPGPIAVTPRKKKKLIRRTARDYSQRLRLGFQLAFLALNGWVGTQFYHWVRWAETAGTTREVARPAGVEGWLPIAGLMQFKYVLLTREMPRIHPAGFFLFTAFLLMSFLLRKSFCSWLCPVGTASEYLWKLGRSIFRRNFALPRWLDIPLRGLKYLLFGFFAYAVFSMSAAAIAQFLTTPYGLIVDVRMLNFFRYLGGVSAFVVLGLVIASVLIQNFWCRYLCPYGALLGLAALASPCVSLAASPLVSIARNARKPAPHRCRSTSSSRSAPPSAPDAWNA